MSQLNSIDLNVAERLRRDPEFRREWFRAELESSVPDQIRALREERDMTQAELAKATGYDGEKPMKQSAISRFERSTDARWSLPTVVRMAEAANGVVRVIIIPAEQAIDAIEAEEKQQAQAPSTAPAINAAKPVRSALETGKYLRETASYWQMLGQKLESGMPPPPSVSATTSIIANIIGHKTKDPEQWNLSRLMPAE